MPYKWIPVQIDVSHAAPRILIPILLHHRLHLYLQKFLDIFENAEQKRGSTEVVV